MNISTTLPPVAAPVRPLLIAGANGTLGQAFQRICDIRGLVCVALNRAQLDITDPASVESCLEHHNPWAVVNAAGYVRVDDAETDFLRCYRENTTGPAILAAACAQRQLQLLTFSSDLVFDGSKDTAYLESDPTGPLNVYGNSKRLAEQQVLALLPAALVVRTSAFFGPWDEYNFVHQALRAARQGQRFAAADDVLISPTYVPDLVNTALDLLLDEECGVWHLANEGACSWAALARQALALAGLDMKYIQPQPMAAFGLAAARPRYSVLSSSQGQLLRSVTAGLESYLTDVASRPQSLEQQVAAAS